MLFKKESILYPVLLSSTFLLTGCEFGDDDAEEASHEASICSESAKEIHTSDDRTLCVTLTSFKATAPLQSGFNAPAKSTQTVFISDSNGTPLNVENDEVITGISQYPMMNMDSGHKHSAPYSEADVTAAEYGAYNLDIYYPMASTMGRWEYRIKLTDNNGTEDTTDDKTHTVTFEPTVEMVMGSNVFRGVSKNENDLFKNSMGIEATRQYSTWIESVGPVGENTADMATVKLRLTTQDMDHTDMSEMSMSKPSLNKVSPREEEHVHETAHSDGMADTDSQTYPAIHEPMTMMGSTMSVSLHAPDNEAVAVSTVVVEVSTDSGTNWTALDADMSHEGLGNYSADDVPMAAGDVVMHVKVTVNGNVMTKTGVVADGVEAAQMPELKFTAIAAE